MSNGWPSKILSIAHPNSVRSTFLTGVTLFLKYFNQPRITNQDKTIAIVSGMSRI